MVSAISVSLSCIMDSKTQDSRFDQIKLPNSGSEAPRDVYERRKKQKSVSGALSNRKHGLFHLGYFKNGLLKPG